MNHIDKYLNIKLLKELKTHLVENHEPILFKAEIKNNELVVCTGKQHIPALLKVLRDDQKYLFKVLVDICGVDYPNEQERFEVVYHLLSLKHNTRIRVKTKVADGASVPTVTHLYSVANWYEREAYDMFGIKFEGHPDLRRLLTDYDFEGHPLRKDFPLSGFTEVYYDEKLKRVAYKPVDKPQEFRQFDRISKWEAMTGNFDLAEDKDSVFDPKEFEKDEEVA